MLLRLNAAEHLLRLLELPSDRLGDAVVPVEVVVIAEVRLDGLWMQYGCTMQYTPNIKICHEPECGCFGLSAS